MNDAPGRVDGAALLAGISGLSREDVIGIWDRVKADRAKADDCPQHRFAGGPAKLGAKYPCLSCGVSFGLMQIGSYIQGVEAMGGHADRVVPGWGAKP